jgi:hypothetical protein
MYMRYIQVLTRGQVSLQTDMYQFCVSHINADLSFRENIVSIEPGILTNGPHLFQSRSVVQASSGGNPPPL